uniref:BZIP domain-containing protein n=1 Tax=Hanusia phi TaxID=3032 RepID=A0A7S0DU60_9CRYP|mmetsp:Transcript_10256/g.23415  ORF Transcript_10256/g.23415 Transcript_10256/m.23415 type:complete len:214 (+) Transcript_10256:409-1050(+)
MKLPSQAGHTLEEELNVLLQFQEKLDNGDSGEINGEELKKRVRVIKNRIAAKKSREQARTYVQKLESSLNAVMAHNDALARRLAMVESENRSLKHSMFVSGMNFQTMNSCNRVDESAVLSTLSLLLDAVLFMIVMASSFLPGFSLIAWEEPSPVHHLKHTLPQAACKLTWTRTFPGQGARRCLRRLRMAGLLQCLAHSCHRWEPQESPPALAA